jgi:hypothetical protein
VILLTVVGGGSILLQGAVLGGLFQLVNALKGGFSLELAGRSWDLRDPLVFTVMMIGFGVVLTGAGLGWLLFNRLVNGISVIFERNIVGLLIDRYLSGWFGQERS